MIQLVLRLKIMIARYRYYCDEQERLRMPYIAGVCVRRYYNEGKVWHHVGLVHFHQRLGSLDGHNIIVDNVAVTGSRRRAWTSSCRTAFRKRLLHDRAFLL